MIIWRITALALWLALSTTAAAEAEKTYRMVTGHGGVPLATVTWGNPKGVGILFIHGFSQSIENFRPQLDDDALTAEFRMAAFDLRGHGASGKPWLPEAYNSTRPFSDDVAAVIAATGLKEPVLVGWSLGGLIAMDYVRHHGDENISGLHIVGSIAGLGPRQLRGTISDPESERRRHQISDDILLAADGSGGLVDYLTATPLSPDQRRVLVLNNMMTPAYVRRLIAAHPWPNEDLIPRIDVPVLFTQGSRDRAIEPATIPAIAARFKNAKVSTYDGLGHSPFWEDTPRFNRELAEFVRSVQR